MPDVLGTQRGLIHHLCLERNQDQVPVNCTDASFNSTCKQLEERGVVTSIRRVLFSSASYYIGTGSPDFGWA